MERTQQDPCNEAFEYRTAMRELVALTGHEFPQRDHRLGLSHVLDETCVRLEEGEEAAIGTVLTALARHARFGGNRFMAPETGEDPATHSLHVALLCTDLIRRVEGLSSSERTQLIDDAVRASIVHDVGEVLGELTTLHDRLEGTGPEEDFEFERELTYRALHLSLALHRVGEVQSFGEVMQLLSEEILQTGDRKGALATIDELIAAADLSVDQSDGGAVAHRHALVDRWMKLYDAVEDPLCRPEEERFVGYFVKTVEHLQGSRHFLRFSRKDDQVRSFTLEGEPTLPWASSQQQAAQALDQLRGPVVMGGVKYNEALLGDMFDTAQSEGMRNVAKATRDAVYQFTIEYLDMATPIVERSAVDLRPEIGKAVMDLAKRGETEMLREIVRAEQKELVLEHRRQRLLATDDTAELLPVETRVRLQALYRNAIERDYVPAVGEVLVEADTLPSELAPLEPRTSGLARRGVARVQIAM